MKETNKMKKLMIAACAIAIAAAAQAANVQWKWTSTLYDHVNGDAAYNGTVYIVNANSYSQQTVLDAILAGGDLADYAMGNGISTANGKAPSAASVIANSAAFAPTRTDSELKYADYFYAALTTDGDGKAYLFLGSQNSKNIDSVSDTTLSSSLSSSKSFVDGTTFSSQGWYSASAVPEPTSGLLLLLGVAGLALRRRRA